jgi:hypothetical protein
MDCFNQCGHELLKAGRQGKNADLVLLFLKYKVNGSGMRAGGAARVAGCSSKRI